MSLEMRSSTSTSGVGDPAELRRRLALCTDQDTTRGMFFNGALAALRSISSADAVEACMRASEIDGKIVDLFNYPVAAFLKMAWKATEFIGPTLGSPEAVFRRMGGQAVEDFLASGMGRTLLTLAGKNPRRLVMSVPNAYKVTVSYGERSVTWLSESSAVIHFRRDLMHPAYHEGVLATAIAAFGGEAVRVSSRVVGPLDTDFDVSWK